MLFKKLIRTFGKYKGQFISMIIMVVLGIGLFSGFSAEWYTIEKNTAKFYNETNFADYRVYDKSGNLTQDDIEKISSIEGVEAVSRFIEISTTESKEGDTLKLAVTENFNVSSFKLLSGEKYDKDSLDGLWISSNYSKRNDYKVGDEITIKYYGISLSFIIKGIIMSSEYLINTTDGALMPDFNALGYAYISPKAYEKLSNKYLGKTIYYQANIISSIDSEILSEKIDKALGKTIQLIDKEDVTSYSEAKGEVDEGKTMGSIVPVIFLLIAVLTMVTTMNRITSQEKSQIGILKALGFKNKQIIWHYTSYALFVGILGSIIGLGLGYVVCHIFMSENGSMGTYFEMPYWNATMPWFVYIGIAGIIGFLTLIGYLSVYKQLKGSAVDALKPYEPMAMSSLAIEKTKAFHKLHFTTRWNLRDTFRHKARTFMSIFGVFGCTLLMFASFGMQSTMQNFINTNYDLIMNYNTSITLSSSVSQSSANEIINQYNGDYSANVPIKIEGNTYVMTIFNNSHDMYRILSNNTNLKNTRNDGIYICTRLSEELNKKAGDQLEFCLYGDSNIKYTANIVDVVSSNIEGFQISEEYAKNLNIDYTIDTIYTNASKSDISINNNIANVQSKEEVIKTFDTFLEIMNMMIVVLVIFSLVLAFVVLYNLGSMTFIERYRELATLKVLGFKDKVIGWILISQNIWLSVIGVVLGCPAGYLTLKFLYKMLASEYELTVVCDWYVYVISIVLSLVVSFIMSWLTSLKVKKIDMVSSLKAE